MHTGVFSQRVSASSLPLCALIILRESGLFTGGPFSSKRGPSRLWTCSTVIQTYQNLCVCPAFVSCFCRPRRPDSTPLLDKVGLARRADLRWGPRPPLPTPLRLPQPKTRRADICRLLSGSHRPPRRSLCSLLPPGFEYSNLLSTGN